MNILKNLDFPTFGLFDSFKVKMELLKQVENYVSQDQSYIKELLALNWAFIDHFLVGQIKRETILEFIISRTKKIQPKNDKKLLILTLPIYQHSYPQANEICDLPESLTKFMQTSSLKDYAILFKLSDSCFYSKYILYF